MVLRDGSLVGPNGPWSFSQQIASLGCDLSPVFSKVDSGQVLDAAIDSTREWITKGWEGAPTRVFVRSAAGGLVRDSLGNVQGGVRIAQFTAPTAFLAINGPSVFCAISGHHSDFTAEELKERYRTHDDYVAQVRSAMKHRVHPSIRQEGGHPRC
jgi:hypothetical protein